MKYWWQQMSKRKLYENKKQRNFYMTAAFSPSLSIVCSIRYMFVHLGYQGV